jgi:site-specific DNA-methyltransferase (adenine-specific)
MKELADDGVKVDMVLTDPPYGVTACKWDAVIPFNKMWSALDGVTEDNTPILLFGTEPFISNLRMSNIENYRYDWYWKKGRFSNFQQVRKQPGRIIECIAVFYKKQPYYNPIMEKGEPYVRKATYKRKSNHIMGSSSFVDRGQVNSTGDRFPRNVLEFKMHNVGNYHPTQKPVKLLEYLVKIYTEEGDTVLDFTMGSGSTGEACKNTNRDFIGIELEKTYFKRAVKRLKSNEKGR